MRHAGYVLTAVSILGFFAILADMASLSFAETISLLIGVAGFTAIFAAEVKIRPKVTSSHISFRAMLIIGVLLVTGSALAALLASVYVPEVLPNPGGQDLADTLELAPNTQKWSASNCDAGLQSRAIGQSGSEFTLTVRADQGDVSALYFAKVPPPGEFDDPALTVHPTTSSEVAPQGPTIIDLDGPTLSLPVDVPSGANKTIDIRIVSSGSVSEGGTFYWMIAAVEADGHMVESLCVASG